MTEKCGPLRRTAPPPSLAPSGSATPERGKVGHVGKVAAFQATAETTRRPQGPAWAEAFQMHLLSSPPASCSEGEPIDRRIRDDDRRDQTTGVTERQQWRQQGPLCLFSHRPTRRSVLFPSVRRPGCEPCALIPLSDLLCCRRSECALAQAHSNGAGEPSLHTRDTHESHNSGRPLTRYNGSEQWKHTRKADYVCV